MYPYFIKQKTTGRNLNQWTIITLELEIKDNQLKFETK